MCETNTMHHSLYANIQIGLQSVQRLMKY